jgi:Zn-dependent M16 (insulinase) family peptidase
MNAMTTPDMTCYPFSTQNPSDFYNLMNIYLDATLNPLLRKDDFLQEGWRLDFK